MKDSIIRNSNKLIYKLIIFIFWIAIWQLIYNIIGRDIYVPSPFNVFFRLKELIFVLSFWKTVVFSIYRVVLGLILSLLMGLIFGILASVNKFIYDLINPLMIAIKSTPVMSFIIIALIWFSSSNVPIFICFLMCFPVIWTNVIMGFENVDKKLIEMAKVYQVKRLTVFRKIYLPSIIPYFSAACITSLGIGWKVSVAAEVLSHPRNSIGSQLYSAKVYLDSTELFAWTLVVIFLSFIFELLFERLIRRATMKKETKRKETMEAGGGSFGSKGQGVV